MLEQQYEQKAITESSLADLRQLLNDISEHVRNIYIPIPIQRKTCFVEHSKNKFSPGFQLMAKNCPWLSVPAQLSMIDDDDEPPIDFFLFIISLSLLERVKRQTNNLFKTIIFS